MNHHLQRHLRYTLLAGAMAAAGGASAQSWYYGEVSAGANAIGFGITVQPASETRSANSPTPFSLLQAGRDADLTHSAATAALRGRAAALAAAEPGAVHLLSLASGHVTAGAFSAPNPNASGQAVATALARDVFSFNVPTAAAGASFTVSAGFSIALSNMLNQTLVDGVAPSFLSAASGWQTRVSMASTAGWLFQNERQASCQWVAGPLVCSGDTPGWAPVFFTVSNGSNVVFEMSATTRSSAGALLAGLGSAYSESIVDMSHTLAWGGVTAVWDAAGNPVSNFSMLGLGSGVDFRLPHASLVPEPASGVLALAGLALIVGWSRLQRLVNKA